MSTQSSAEWRSLDQRGVDKGCLVFSVALRRFPEQEVGGKKVTGVSLSEGTVLAVGLGLVTEPIRLSSCQPFSEGGSVNLGTGGPSWALQDVPQHPSTLPIRCQ